MKKFLYITLFFSALVCDVWAQTAIDRLRNNSMERDSVVSLQEMRDKRREIIRIADSIQRADSLKNDTFTVYIKSGPKKPEEKATLEFPLITAGEVLGFNGFIWAWDYYILDKSYAHTGPSYWKRNFKEGWKWDHNHWAVNFYGHPYQGSMYYSFARAGGYGFYGSMLWTALGSVTWEMFCETEYPAPNDLITTSIGGSMYGEVLYRLSRLVYNTEEVPWYRQVAAFFLQPAGYVQRKAFGNRDFYTGYTPVELYIGVGAGSRFGSDYRVGGHSSDDLDEEWNDNHSMIFLDLEYGKPYQKVKKPFDYFTLNIFGEGGFEGNLLELDIMGKLANFGMHGRGHWLDFSVNLDYDSFYGELATISTISIGGALDIAFWLTQKVRFRMMNQVNYIILGSADMGYDDLIEEAYPDYVSEKNNYQYNLGVKYDLMTEILYKDKWRIYNKISAIAMRTIPNSYPHYGTKGWDFLIFNHSVVEYKLFNWLSVGTRLDTYIKLAAYSSDLFEPMSRRIYTLSTYFSFRLL